MASSEVYEVVLSGGAPWGFRLQGGREFRAPLRIAKVTPNSKAEMAGIVEGLLVKSINNTDCEDWTHSDALNSIKKTGSMLKMILCRRPVSTPDFVSSDGGFFTPSSSYTTDDLRNGSASTHVSKATFKPSSSNDTLSYVTMPRGQEKRDVDAKRWRNIEENNNNAFNSRKDDLSNSNEWNPDIISGVVRPPEQIKLVHGMEALRSVSNSSSASEPTSQVRVPADTRGFVDKPRPIGRGGRRLTTGSIGSEEDFNMANGDASSSDSAPSTTNRPALQQFKKQKEQAAIEASKEPKPIRTVLPPTQNKPRKYSEEPRTSEPNPPGPHRPSIQRGGKWYKEMFKELHSSAGTSSNLSGLLASDVAKGTVRNHESTGSISPRSASPSPDHRGDNEVFTNRTDYVNDVPVKNTGSLSSEPRASWSSSDDDRKLPSWQQKQQTSEKRPSRVSASHVPAWYKDMQRGVEVPVQKIEEPESYVVQKRPSYANVGEERRFQEPQVSIAPMAMKSSPSSNYIDNRRAPVGMTVQMEEKYQPPTATSLYESRFRGRQGAARKASEELQVRQQPPSDEDVFRRREEEAARRRREEEEEQRRREEEERRRREAEEEMMRRKREEEEERLRREYESELARRRREEEERARREASKPQFLARALYTFNGQTAKELSFRKGDVISVRRQVDKNWIDGELNGRRGIFPTNYVEVRPVEEDDEPTHVPRVQVVQHETPPQQRQPASSPQAQQVSTRPATQTVNVEGEAKVKYNFKAETHRELPCSKGDIISLVRKVDSNWYEGRVGDRKGIVPSSYLEVYREPEIQVIRQEQIQPVPSARVEQAPDYGRTELGYDQRQHQQSRGPSGNMYSGHAPKQTQVKYIEEREKPRFGNGGVVAHAVIDEPPRIGHEQGERYRAMFSYEPVNEDELRLEEGDEVIVLEKCDDGWFVGTSARTNLFGTFPGNYVEKVK